MDQLIDTIRAAIATDASSEQKAAGLQACRTIAAALDTEPGKPIVLPGTPPQSPLAGIKLDQMLDLLIARLTTIANARSAPSAPPSAAPSANGLRIPAVIAPPRQVARPTPPARPANSARPAPTKKP